MKEKRGIVSVRFGGTERGTNIIIPRGHTITDREGLKKQNKKKKDTSSKARQERDGQEEKIHASGNGKPNRKNARKSHLQLKKGVLIDHNLEKKKKKGKKVRKGKVR